jgi:hypothetical protein
MRRLRTTLDLPRGHNGNGAGIGHLGTFLRGSADLVSDGNNGNGTLSDLRRVSHMKASDKELVETFRRLGVQTWTARELGLSRGQVSRRLRMLGEIPQSDYKPKVTVSEERFRTAYERVKRAGGMRKDIAEELDVTGPVVTKRAERLHLEPFWQWRRTRERIPNPNAGKLKRQRGITDDMVQAVLDATNTNAEAAAMLQVSERMIRARKKRMGLSRQRVTDAAIDDSYLRGGIVAEMGRRIGLTEQAFAIRAKSRGLDVSRTRLSRVNERAMALMTDWLPQEVERKQVFDAINSTGRIPRQGLLSLRAKLKYLYNNFGIWGPELSQWPSILSWSLEDRITPRLEYYEEMGGRRGMIKDNLYSIFIAEDSRFVGFLRSRGLTGYFDDLPSHVSDYQRFARQMSKDLNAAAARRA